MITINLAQFKLEKEAEWGRRITWDEIIDGANISRATLARLLSNTSQRPDVKTIDKLCKFFNVPSGTIPFITYESNGH